MIVDLIAQADVDAVWPLFGEEIARCCKNTPTHGVSAGDYWTMCRAGMAFPIAIHDGQEFIALSIWRYEDDDFRCLIMVGKRMRFWVAHLLRKASEISKSGGGSGRLQFDGRKEMAAMFKKHAPNVRVVRYSYEVTP